MCSLSPACIHALVEINWWLVELDLSWAALDATSLSALAQADLRILAVLKLRGNQLCADAVHPLVNGQFPALLHLDLSANRFDAAAALQLIDGDWPQLEVLNLSENCLDNAAMRYLGQEDGWPLNTLKLEGNNIGLAGVDFLTEGQWDLTYLSLGADSLSAATGEILSLDPADLQGKMISVITCRKVSVARPLAGLASCPCCHRVTWPHLSQVHFVLLTHGLQC